MFDSTAGLLEVHERCPGDIDNAEEVDVHGCPEHGVGQFLEIALPEDSRRVDQHVDSACVRGGVIDRRRDSIRVGHIDRMEAHHGFWHCGSNTIAGSIEPLPIACDQSDLQVTAR
jgi:hypothetical protein